VRGPHEGPERIEDIDDYAEACTLTRVARQASRTQGRALLETSAAIFDAPLLQDARVKIREKKLRFHVAPAFGLVTRAASVPVDEALVLFLHTSLRGALSAAVRLGIVGPHAAQRMHHAAAPLLDEVIASTASLPLGAVAQTSPLLELVQSTHDRLYARLFQS
jgi:urease accessory protein